ncbi:hypothetical protein WDV06_18470 [Streptomyces racemochromogenes]|uniref:Uncharacterized protein n=1 Tax=Streptomyces racemochromogenes TaxID=67353 RepID=A0ABW7PGH0_9ACTN
MQSRPVITVALVVALTLAVVVAIGALPHDVQPMPRILALAIGISTVIYTLRRPRNAAPKTSR